MYAFNTDDNTESVYFFIIQLKIVFTITQLAFEFSATASIWKKIWKKCRKKNETGEMYQHGTIHV